MIFLLGLLWIVSPGNPQPLSDQNGNLISNSISEKTFVDINGVRQGMIIKSKDPSNPVLLYLHGGMPEYFLSRQYPTGLEDNFTVVWWEQRGSGLSYDPETPRESINSEQLIADTLAVTNYLRQRFKKDKIYLMSHSGGTFIGIQAAARAPELYYAYIGVAQVSDQFESERLAYEYMLEEFKANGNDSMVRKLEAAPVSIADGISDKYLSLRDMAMHSLGVGTTHVMKSVLTGIFLPSLFHPEYTFMEKINLWRAKSQSGVSSMWKEMINTDMSEKIPELDIPVYFFEGVHDYTCSFSGAQSYFKTLKAPLKGLYIFEQSAHSPVFEEPDKAITILKEDVLQGKNELANLK